MYTLSSSPKMPAMSLYVCIMSLWCLYGTNLWETTCWYFPQYLVVYAVHCSLLASEFDVLTVSVAVKTTTDQFLQT